MSITVTEAQAIKDLVSNDAALREALRVAPSREDFTHTLALAARAKGIELEENALAESLDVAIDQYVDGGELSDEQLEAVAGGVEPVVTALLLGFVIGVVIGSGAVAVGAWMATERR